MAMLKLNSASLCTRLDLLRDCLPEDAAPPTPSPGASIGSMTRDVIVLSVGET
jgi:hypothetical protein